MIKIRDILSNSYTLIGLIIIAFIYNIVVYNSSLVKIIMFLVFMYFLNLYKVGNKLSNSEFKTDNELKEKHINEIVEKDISHHKNNNFYIDNSNIYKIFKKPNKFTFLQKNKYLEEVIYDLRFIEKYDRADFFRMLILMNDFLKIYYNIIIDKYDETNIDILVDIRLELLNTIYNFIVDCPIYSQNKKKRIDIHIYNNLLKVQSYTYKKLKNLNKKYPNFNVKNPRPYNKDTMEDNYNIVV